MGRVALGAQQVGALQPAGYAVGLAPVKARHAQVALALALTLVARTLLSTGTMGNTTTALLGRATAYLRLVRIRWVRVLAADTLRGGRTASASRSSEKGKMGLTLFFRISLARGLTLVVKRD